MPSTSLYQCQAEDRTGGQKDHAEVDFGAAIAFVCATAGDGTLQRFVIFIFQLLILTLLFKILTGLLFHAHVGDVAVVIILLLAPGPHARILTSGTVLYVFCFVSFKYFLGAVGLFTIASKTLKAMTCNRKVEQTVLSLVLSSFND